ncbi:hypothetical protein [Amnibacterium sp.]|uniref:hypothetical protein n=1 Tax=Amnibacterium sp. TaxID=1872496 RepID=UPI002622F0AB|nr:hypothetical protein [Amnibacterium sp.]MCU1472174.1 hypothetical protein [Amnibacterium sp.]
MDRTLDLPDAAALVDLQTYLGRADAVERASVRLVGGAGVLAVYTAVLYPSGLLDDTPTVLGLRTVGIDPEQDLDVVVPIASFVERLKRASESLAEAAEAVQVGIPAEVNTVTWAGVAPPRSGWVAVGQTQADVLTDVAKAGIVEVAEALPTDAGEPLVRRVRADVWSRPIEGAEHVPAGAAFAAHSLGFLGDPLEQIPIYDSGPWTRLSTERGHVLVKRRAWSLQG